jgi:hypothetical protein
MVRTPSGFDGSLLPKRQTMRDMADLLTGKWKVRSAHFGDDDNCRCSCWAEYRRAEEKFLIPHTGDAICTVFGAALEAWSENRHVPSYEPTNVQLVSRDD